LTLYAELVLFDTLFNPGLRAGGKAIHQLLNLWVMLELLVLKAFALKNLMQIGEERNICI